MLLPKKKNLKKLQEKSVVIMKAKSDRTYHGLVRMEKESAGNGFLNLEKREEERHGAGVS